MNRQVKFCNEEELFFNLKKLYEGFGYGRFKMGKFEEYSVYLENKSFLKSPYVITFTDLNGKLMALKPDVTLSIVKNSKAGLAESEKVYYKESVYRPDKTTKEFKEISQVGLEFIGDIDDYAMLEVLFLAAKSLSEIDDAFVLDVSHPNVVTGLLEEYGIENYAQEIYGFLTSKNAHDVKNFCLQKRISDDFADKIVRLTAAYGSFADAVAAADSVAANPKSKEAVRLLEKIQSALGGMFTHDKIRLDFSIINDTDYYNGIVFQGYVSGAPRAVLSGGRYDKLAGKFVKDVSAMGFAVYLNELPMYLKKTDGYDGDALVIHGGSDAQKVLETVKNLADEGKKVRVEKTVPQKLKFKEIVDLR